MILGHPYLPDDSLIVSRAFLSCILSCYFKVKLGGVQDVTYWLGASLVADVVEINLGIIVGCFPVIQPALAPLSATTKKVLAGSWTQLSSGKTESTTAISNATQPKGAKTFLDTSVTIDDKTHDTVVTETELIYMRPVSPSSPLPPPKSQGDRPAPARRSSSWIQRNIFRPGSSNGPKATVQPRESFSDLHPEYMQEPPEIIAHPVPVMQRTGSESSGSNGPDPWVNRNVV